MCSLFKQKPLRYIFTALLLLISLLVSVSTSSPSAYAATDPSCIQNSKCATQPAGTCFAHIQGVGYKIEKCSALGVKNGSKADDKSTINLSKYCYSYESSLDNNIARVNCNDTSLSTDKPVQMCDDNGKSEVCQFCSDGSFAPNNDKSQCSVDGGSKGSNCTVGNEATCSSNLSSGCDDVAQSANGGDAIAHCTDPALSSDNSVQCNAKSCNLVDKYINPLVQLLSALIGVAVTISRIRGGIQYSTSAGDPVKVSASKNRIRNSIIAFVAFLFLYAFLQFLVPGGIFNR